MEQLWRLTKPLSQFLLPGGLLVLAALLFLRPHVLPGWTLPLVQAYAYIVLAAGLLLGWMLHRSRMVLAILILALANWALLVGVARENPLSDSGRILFNSVALLLPLNVLGLNFISDRGSRRRFRTELGWLGLILLQVVLVGGLAHSRQVDVVASLETLYLDPRWTDWTPIAQPGLLAFGLALILQAARFILERNPFERGFFWALVACFLAVHGSPGGWSPTNFLATGGLILIIGGYEATYKLKYYDRLTGVPSRRAFEQALFRLRGPYALALVDLDRLKSLNSDFGLHVGNKLLRMVAEKVHALSGGKAFRYDGGKFVVLYPGRSAEDVRPSLEQLRERIEAGKVIHRDRVPRRTNGQAREPLPPRMLSVTVSIGVAERDSRKSTHDLVMKAAEKALFRAKYGGRNQVKS